ncbi:MAG: ABC transporter ATP-binding protein [Nanoarchaeota archaeon]|nr:ABC transporter ATP-binding protein [Nanoarchaeota archaeon]
MTISLKIDKISKSFKNNQILKEINLEGKSSEIIGLIGPSGCGKSTLLKILVGYYKPNSGSILINNKKISKNIINLRKIVGYTTQENSFYEKLTIMENMRYYSNLYGIHYNQQTQIINNILEKVELLRHKKTLTENISGGMKRRLDFAISLIHNPSILILDEPTTGLDPLLVDQFWNIVKNIMLKENKIVIISSHIITEIEKYCTKVAIMKDGHIVKILNKNEIKSLEKKFRKITK